MQRPRLGHLGLLGALLLTSRLPGAITESNVLLLWNSQNADSQQVRDLYIAAHPGVHELDLNDPLVPQGSISRAEYVSRIRTPVRDFINGVGTGNDLSAQIMVIATTRGLPGRIISPVGTDEFELFSAWSSIESDLALLQQDLEAAGTTFLPFRYSGMVDNPYHRSINQPIDSFSRLDVTTARTFSAVSTPVSPTESVEVWQAVGLTPGDMYLVCRLDSGPATFGSAAAITNIAALIQRSQSLTICAQQVQTLFDEYSIPPATFELDSGELPPLLLGIDDFELAAGFTAGLNIETLHDETATFFDGPSLPTQTKPIVALATYGENHDINGWGADPPGAATYIQTYNLHPAAVFLPIESWSATSIHSPTNARINQQGQVLTFIERGGSFAVGQVMEPFSFTVADIEIILVNMLAHNLTYAEAVWSALPALSWQNIPVGDPLARITVTSGAELDRNADNRIDVEDLYVYEALPQDHTCDGVVNDQDRIRLRDAVRTGESTSLLTTTP